MILNRKALMMIQPALGPRWPGRIFCALLGLLAWLGAARAVSAGPGAPGAEVAPPAGFHEVGGSNYVMYHVAPEYRQEHNVDSWWRPGVLQPVIGTFHEQGRQAVLDQLKTMHDGGQRKIALVLWHMPMNGEPDAHDNICGHALRSDGGALTAQHQANLKNLLLMIKQTGYFNELDFRFGPQGNAHPGEWSKWDEARYQENWNFLVATRKIVEDALKGGSMKVLYDLGVEYAGDERAQAPAYMKRLWQDYTAHFGKRDCYGFSFALEPGEIGRMLKMYDQTGVRPDVFALDVYDLIPQKFAAAAEEFKAAGIDRPRIIIQETYHNDANMLAQLQQAQKEHQFEFLYLMQWPLDPGIPHCHFNMDFPSRYDAYLGRPAALSDKKS